MLWFFALPYRISSYSQQEAPSHRGASYFKNRTDCAVVLKPSPLFFKSACKFLCSSSRVSAFSIAVTLSHLCKELLLASVKVCALASAIVLLFFINALNCNHRFEVEVRVKQKNKVYTPEREAFIVFLDPTDERSLLVISVFPN